MKDKWTHYSMFFVIAHYFIKHWASNLIVLVGLTAGREARRQADKIRINFKIIKRQGFKIFGYLFV